MTTVAWSALDNGQSIAFDPLQDVLSFDSFEIHAAQVVAVLGGGTLALTHDGKTVTLQVNPLTATQASFVFADGSRLLIGDGATGTANDDLANTLTGGAGADQLFGLGGNDFLVGGAGADRFDGGAGNDTYVVNGAFEHFRINDSAGIDTVVSNEFLTVLLPGLENLTLAGRARIGVGNDAANLITGTPNSNWLIGNGGNDTLVGGGGADILDGGAGNDTFVINDTRALLVEAVGGGTDIVNSSVSHTLGANLENLTLTGAALAGTGNALANVITGNGLANVLDGGVGADTLNGGAGNDTYVVDNTLDAVNETLSGGIDRVEASVNWTLGPNLENLKLTGAGNLTGTGNGLNNLLEGNSGNNVLTGADGNDTLDGGSGADTMIGGAGNDSYAVNSGTDVVTEAASAGTDSVSVSSNLGTYTLGANVENGTALTAAGAMTLNGNALDNLLTGNESASLITGGDGNDTLFGGGGNDTLQGGNGTADVAAFSGVQGDYVISQSGGTVTVVGTDGTDTLTGIELLKFGNNAAITVTAAIDGQLPESMPEYALDALQSGGEWIHTGGVTLQLDFSFMSVAPSYGTDSTGFMEMTAAQKLAVRGVLDMYETYLDIQFTEVTDSNTGVDLRFARNDQGSGTIGYAYLPGRLGFPAEPNNNTNAGDVWINNNLDSFNGGTDPGQPLWAGLIHEIGHALGLKHPFDATLDAPVTLTNAGYASQDNDRFTVMSYTPRSDALILALTGAEFGGSTVGGGNWTPETPMLFDIGALQSLYGANDTLSAGNDVYTIPNDRPSFSVIWDAGGIDNLDASAFSSNSTLDLREGHFSTIGHFGFNDNGTWIEGVPSWFPSQYPGVSPSYGGNNVAIAYGAVIENALGGSGNDTLIGNDADNGLNGGAGNDFLDGGLGNDSLTGGAGTDTLTGGDGADSFVFTSLTPFDVVQDFVAGTDKLVFDNAIFTQLVSEGVLAAGALRIGAGFTQGGDADDRIIFNTTTGALYYDADGLGGASSVGVAVLTDVTTLAATDFLVT